VSTTTEHTDSTTSPTTVATTPQVGPIPTGIAPFQATMKELEVTFDGKETLVDLPTE